MINTKRIQFLILVLFALLPSMAQDLLQSAVSKEDLTTILIPREAYFPVPPPQDRQSWEQVDPELQEAYISSAERLLDYQWPSISASTTLLFVSTGDRDEYQELSFAKRTNLNVLVLAELLEDKGRFTEQIMNGIWSICEESDWGVPAHYKHSAAGSGLPDLSNPWVDLFAAETVSTLAWADYLVGEKLDGISPLIRKRIRFEADRRIFQPILKTRHQWMDWTFNWNTWISSNWLNASLLLLDEPEERALHVSMVLESLDNFLNPYPADGGCDEGPGYWNAAGASLFESLELLNLATGGKFQVFDEPGIRNIGSYIYKMQISGNNFINFADADNRVNPDGEWIYRFGKRIDDPLMMSFGAGFVKPGEARLGRSHLTRTVLTLPEQTPGRKLESGFPLPADVWFPEIEVMVSRDWAGSDKGLFLAAKGGHNGEAHNHNDVGNFIVYYDGTPVLIDAGRGTYTARFFGPDRWSLWMTNSRHHNVPGIFGTEQPVGNDYRATEVHYRKKGNTVSLEMELKEAYGEDSGIESLERTLVHRKERSVSLSDHFVFTNAGKLSETLMTLYEPDLSENGEIKLEVPLEGGDIKTFQIIYDRDLLEADYMRIPLDLVEDEAIRRKWGPDIFRISLETKEATKRGKIDLKMGF